MNLNTGKISRLLITGAILLTLPTQSAWATGGSVTYGLSATPIAQCDGTSTVTLNIDGVSPQPSQVAVDVVLVLDRSGSMIGSGVGGLQNAANTFVTHMDENDGANDGTITTSRVGMVSFNQAPALDSPLTFSASAVHTKINALVANGNTNIGDAVTMAKNELAGGSAKDVMLVMTDGQSNVGTNPLTAAASAKAAGIEIFTIGLGTGVNVAQLQAMATNPAHFYLAPTAAQLVAIFDQIAIGVAGPAATELTYTVHPAPGFTLTGASASKGTALQAPASLSWTLNELRTESVTITYTLQHTGTTGGLLPIHDVAALTYKDSDGNTQTSDYSSVTVDVRGCNQPPVANAGPDQTVPQDSSGLTSVTLDGTGSTDDGQLNPLAYSWSEGATPLGTGASLAASFGLGSHTVTLTVDDGQYQASDTVTITVTDPFPPVTAAALAGTAGQNGWYLSPVTVSLSASDNPGGSGVKETHYSVDGGADSLYAGPFALSADGIHQVGFFSIDQAGNVEAAQSVEVRIDQTAPTITVSSPLNETYADDAMLTVGWTAADPVSGVAAESAALDGSPITNGAVVDLSTAGLGDHTLTVTATDQAGNAATISVTFRVEVTYDSLAALKHRFFQQGLIKNQGTVTSLDQKLRAAQAAHQRGQSDTEDSILSAFVAEVNAQAAKGILDPAVSTMVRDAQWLMSHN